MPPAFSKLDISSVALQDPSSFLISPLPQFTSTLPAIFDNFAPLPELAEDEDESQGASTDDEDEEAVTPDGSQHQQQLRPAESRDLRPQPVPDKMERLLPAPMAPQEPSGLSRTAPFREHRRRERSSSSPTRPTSRSQSPFDSIITSTSTTPPAGAFHHGTSSRDAHLAPPTQLRSRLQDLLSDTPISSSLPSTSSFTSSLSWDMYKDDRNYTGSSRSSEAIMNTTPQASTSQTVSTKAPPSSSFVGPRMSSASAEAKKLEEERRRKHREDKYGADYDKVVADPDREHRRYLASSGSASLGTSSASQAAWREQQPYGNPLFSNSASSLKRSSTSSGSYGRSSNPTSQDQVAAPPSRHLYGSMNNKNPSKGSAFPASHGQSILAL